MDPSVDFKKVEKAYGNLKAWADRLNIEYTTVHGWTRSKKKQPPSWRIDRIREVAEQDGKDIFATSRRRRNVQQGAPA